MATKEIDIEAILRELINTLIDEFTVDEADEAQHFDYTTKIKRVLTT